MTLNVYLDKDSEVVTNLSFANAVIEFCQAGMMWHKLNPTVIAKAILLALESEGADDE